MEVVSQKEFSTRRWFALAAILLIALAAGMWIWRAQNTATSAEEAGAVQVVSAPVMQADVPARLSANGTVTAVQTVQVPPPINPPNKTPPTLPLSGEEPSLSP